MTMVIIWQPSSNDHCYFVVIILYKQFKRQFNEYILPTPNIGKKHAIIIILPRALKGPILSHLIKLQ